MDKQSEITQVSIPDEVTQINTPEITTTTPHPTPDSPRARTASVDASAVETEMEAINSLEETSTQEAIQIGFL